MKTCTAILVLLLTVCHCRSEDEVPEPDPSSSWAYWQKARAFYELTKARGGELFTTDTNAFEQVLQFFYDWAKEDGYRVPGDVMEWAWQDIDQVGSWEYRILELKTNECRVIENELNALGASRWECFWVEETETGKRFYLKKAGRSYLHGIPTGDLLKLIPSGSDRQTP